MKPIFTYVSNFATSDSFFNVVQNNFIDTNWDLTKFDVSNKKNKNYAEQEISFKVMAEENETTKESVIKKLVNKSVLSVYKEATDQEEETPEEEEKCTGSDCESANSESDTHQLVQTT